MNALVFILSGLSISASGQLKAEGPDRYIHGQSTATSNYVYCYGFPQLTSDDSSILSSTQYFVVNRLELVKDSANYDVDAVISVIKPIQTVRELRKILSPKYRQEFAAALGVETDEEVLTFFKTYKNPIDFSIFYAFMETKVALGHVFVDEEVELGVTYIYSVKRMDVDGTEEEWGYSILTAGVENYTLDYLKPYAEAVAAYDSTVIFEWKLPITQADLAKIPKPKIENDYEQVLIEVLPNLSMGLSSRLYVHNGNSYVEKEKVLGQLNDAMDTLTYSFKVDANPNEIVAAYLRLEDEVGNMGITSDTVFAYTVTPRFMPLVDAIDVTELQDAIQISWTPLDQYPFIAGTIVYRYNSQDVLDTIAIVGASDSVVVDYDLEVGQVYRYKAKALYNEGVQYEQAIPAEGTGEYSKFGIPNIPTYLNAKMEGDFVRLDWEHSSPQSLYGFYIYRGLNPKKTSLVAGPVKGLTYLDTSDALSPRSTYYYRIVAQNLRQDTSDYSEFTSINPTTPMKLSAPQNLDFYFSNGELTISWNDQRLFDNTIEGYIVERKKVDSEEEFIRIGDSIFTKNTAVDYTLEKGDNIEYRVASVSYRGDIGEFSFPKNYEYPYLNLDYIDDFTVRNTLNGILLSIPPLEMPERSEYVVYRRKAGEDKLTKITALKGDEFEYLDSRTEENVLYVYAVTVVDSKGNEGKVSFKQSIRRSLK